MTKQKETSFIKDLIKVQTEVQTLYKDESNPFFKSKYVPLANILREVKPVLNKNGFLLTQQPCIEEGQEVLKTRIIHLSGESMECIAPLKMEEREKNNPQKFGSAITYMRRYTLTSLLALEEDDDDGNNASQQKAPINKQNQFQRIANAAEGDMNATQRKAAEETFRRIKVDLEACGSLAELEAVVDKEKKHLNAFNKYYNDLFVKLKQCKQAMQNVLDPEKEEEEEGVNFVNAG